MDKKTKSLVEDLASTNDEIRMNALQSLLKLTDSKVDWVYEVWDLLLGKLDNENSYQRSIGVMLLCNLAKSDSENRLAASLDRLLACTKDEKFITSRQTLQAIWKATTTKPNRDKVIKHLEKRFVECEDEKHFNLLRQDVIRSFMSLYQETKDETLVSKAQALTAKEKDAKYRKQYEGLLRVK